MDGLESVARGDRYRTIAAEVRAASRVITFEETRSTMLRLAEAYDEAADRLEQRRADGHRLQMAER
jgi:hypothetical protein